MTEALASRVAGLKLSGIVGVLLLPMLVLSYFMVSALRQDMAFAERELAGLELNRLVMPVALSAARQTLNDGEIELLRKKGTPLAQMLGVEQQFSTALATLLTLGNDPRYAIEALVKLQHDSSTSSFIILDPYAETYYLGSVASQQSPALLADFVKLWTLENRAVRDGKITPDEAAKLLIATGVWQESQKRLVTSLISARDASLSSGDYATALAIATEMAEHPKHIAQILSKPSGEAMATGMASTTEFNDGAAHIINDGGELWSFAADRFGILVGERLYSMQFRLYTLLSIAAAACLIGVGGAAVMFRSTLRQLDEVKLARDLAETARLDSDAAAEEVRRINEDVVRLNGELARNLQLLSEAQDESLRKGKMAQLGQLTATVAHELRNPLGAVRTSAFLLERKLKGKALGIEPQLERINSGVTRCDNIITQLLDFARSKAVQREMKSFDDWLAGLIEEEAQKLPAAVAVECNLGLGGAMVAFDPARLSRAVINLLSNASEALVGKGDDPSKFKSKNPVIVISTSLTARGVELAVSDNGPGIAPETLDKIFEPLFTTKNFGTGLGLPAVRKIMEQHGGGIEVQSETGRGARFTAWWPVNAAEQAAA